MSEPVLIPDAAYELLERGNAPRGLRVAGKLDYSPRSNRTPPRALPDGLTVEVLDLTGCNINALPAGLTCYDLLLGETPITELPRDTRVESRLNLSGCDRLEKLPDGLCVGSLALRGCTALQRLPERLDVWFLDLSNCWAFDGWPESANIRSGRLQLQGCTALRSLPPYIRRLAALNVRDCPNLTSLPVDLIITGWLELAHSGLASEASLPAGVEHAQLRWAGINVDRRIAFHPESIDISEILEERNAERRRALLDRYGYRRFIEKSQAEILDQDADPGGQRQLVRVKLEGDEDLVVMSCFCPSTGRQYMIRVPPVTPTCRHAAAWIAGFDDPAEYEPLIET